MATAADVATKVLDGLRRSGETFAPNTDGYHGLLLQFINAAMNETQEAWDWQALRKTVTITGSAATSSYDVDSAGAADIDCGPDARLLWEKQGVSQGAVSESSTYSSGAKPQCFDTTDATAAFRMTYVTPEKMETLHLTDTNQTVDEPGYFTLYRDTDGVDLIFRVYPTPTGIRTWTIRLIDPQADIAKTDTFASVVMQVPIRPIWMKALAWALAERGEENPAFTVMSADYALQSAISWERSDMDDTGYAT